MRYLACSWNPLRHGTRTTQAVSMTRLTAILFVVLLYLAVPMATAADTPLKIGDGHDWSMPAGKWKDDEAGQIRFESPAGPVDEALAFFKPKAWRDVEVECDF